MLRPQTVVTGVDTQLGPSEDSLAKSSSFREQEVG